MYCFSTIKLSNYVILAKLLSEFYVKKLKYQNNLIKKNQQTYEFLVK